MLEPRSVKATLSDFAELLEGFIALKQVLYRVLFRFGHSMMAIIIRAECLGFRV